MTIGFDHAPTVYLKYALDTVPPRSVHSLLKLMSMPGKCVPSSVSPLIDGWLGRPRILLAQEWLPLMIKYDEALG